jgi:Ca-activated chloride channel homolog
MDPIKTRSKSNRAAGRSRNGAMLILVAFAIVMLLVGAAFSVDLAFMFLSQEQLQVATDSAAKAAALTLAHPNDTWVPSGGAKQSAINYASYNKVGGKALTLTTSDINLGKVTYSSSGPWAFVPNGTPTTACQITSQSTVPLFFAPTLSIFSGGTSTTSYTAKCTAGSAFVRNKWCFVFDRSGSMCFDMTGTDYYFPAPIGYHPSTFPPSYNYHYPPSPYLPNATQSRIANLCIGANLFLTALTNSPGGTLQNQVAMVTFSSTGTDSPYYDSTTDCTFTSSYSGVTNKLTYYGSTDIWTSGIANAGTNLHAGLYSALKLFNSSDDGTPWNKIIIVFSDGQWNVGSDPTTLISQAASKNITIHTIGLFTNNTTMQQLAAQTGGQYFPITSTGQQAINELQAAFERLAQTIPIVLTY